MPTIRINSLFAACIGVILGCNSAPDSPTAPGANAAKAASGVTVTAANPPYGKQGESGKQVSILGSGFAPGDIAAWQRNGVTDPKIQVLSTQFVSSSELRATINIADDATVAFYDVAVLSSGRKGGIGTMLFEVTYAYPVPGASNAVALNDNGRVVALTDQIFVYDIATGVAQTLGFSGMPNAIDQVGTTVAGEDEDHRAVIWTFSGSSWSKQPLPSPGYGSGRSIVSDLTGAATIVGGYVSYTVGTGKQAQNFWTPAKWTRTGPGQWTLSLLEQPAGGIRGLIQRITASGMAAGFDGTTCCHAFYWDAGGNITDLPPIALGAASAAWSMNEAGTIIVGTSNGRAVRWSRASSTDLWVTPVPLDNEVCDGVARSINEAGVIVGTSCRGPTAWRPTLNGYETIELGTLGKPCGTQCAVRAVNNAAILQAVGMMGNNSPKPSARGVYWSGF